MEQHVLYTYTRKCVEAKFNFFEKSLPCAQKKHTANSIFAVCQLFAVGCLEAHGKMCVCRVPDLCREPFLLAHGKPSLCRVPDISPTANFVAHGKGTFSGSECVQSSTTFSIIKYIVVYY